MVLFHRFLVIFCKISKNRNPLTLIKRKRISISKIILRKVKAASIATGTVRGFLFFEILQKITKNLWKRTIFIIFYVHLPPWVHLLVPIVPNQKILWIGFLCIRTYIGRALDYEDLKIPVHSTWTIQKSSQFIIFYYKIFRYRYLLIILMKITVHDFTIFHIQFFNLSKLPYEHS